jgi:hypothetical protein
VAARSLLLQDNAVLLHIGTFKTGTTAIQGALFLARSQLAEHGVLHAGEEDERQPMAAVLALRGRRPLVGNPMPLIEQWEGLVAQVAAASDMRVIVSSEHLADADVETARRAVRELGGPRVHVVVTLRPLAKILPSQWQQYVRNQATFTYDRWLDGILRKPPYNKPTPTFWQRHSHDVLVERWASIVGPENVTVIVPDESDREFLLRTFEELVGLPSGLLEQDKEAENRSLTLGEIELVRQLNFDFKRRRWSDAQYKQLVRHGFATYLQTTRIPRPDEPRITTPQWALDRAAEIGAATAEKLPTLGVRIIGDISTLGARLVEEPHEAERAHKVMAIDAARDAVVATIICTDVLRTTPLETTSGRQILRIVAERVWRRLTGTTVEPDPPYRRART